MRGDAFDDLFESDLSRDVPVSDADSAPDLVGDVLDRVDRHRSFVTPAQRRRVLLGRWLLSGFGVVVLLLSAVAYDSFSRDRSVDDAYAVEAGFVPVSGRVREVNDRLRDQITGLVDRSGDAQDGSREHLILRIERARADARQSAAEPVTIHIIPRSGQDDLPRRWELRTDDPEVIGWIERP